MLHDGIGETFAQIVLVFSGRQLGQIAVWQSGIAPAWEGQLNAQHDVRCPKHGLGQRLHRFAMFQKKRSSL